MVFHPAQQAAGHHYVRAADKAIHFANRRFRQRSGDPTAEPCYKLIHNHPAPCEPCGWAAALAEGQLLESEWVFADGTSYQLYDYPPVDMDGVEKVLHLGIDTTERRRAEAGLERAKNAVGWRVKRGGQRWSRHGATRMQAALEIVHSQRWSAAGQRLPKAA